MALARNAIVGRWAETIAEQNSCMSATRGRYRAIHKDLPDSSLIASGVQVLESGFHAGRLVRSDDDPERDWKGRR